ncbi:MAG: hypothetical protein HQ559_13855 [Lentisphaerae bacterium]|nr:hypothetical protein [Lentisphaerota bacterium]
MGRSATCPQALRASVAGELFVEQHWPFGDCAVQFPGYDIKILPPSGVAAEAITGMVLAELHTLRAAGARAQEI